MLRESTRPRRKAAYILRLEREGERLTLRLHDLRSGEQWAFGSWEAMRQHLERRQTQTLK